MPELPIAKHPFKKLGKQLESLCRKALYEHQMLDSVNSIACALSGGKDSLTLLFLLKAILGRGFPDVPLHAIHVSGAYSCGASLQQQWLQAICDELAVPLTIVEQQGGPPTECYSCSRVRRKLLFNTATSLNISTIAFGHHRDDNAQTLLLNLFQKGECAGMLPKIHMHRYHITLIRPLIYLSEIAIRQFAQEHGFLRLTCQCPIGTNSMRKKVDLTLKQVEQLFPHARNNLSLASLTYGSTKAAIGPDL